MDTSDAALRASAEGHVVEGEPDAVPDGAPYEDCTVGAEGREEGAYCVPIAPSAPPVAEVCDGRRVVGLLYAGAACPPAGPGWSGSLLLAEARASGGRAFCVYEWGGAGPPPGFEGLPADSGGPAASWLAADCAALTPLDAADGRIAHETVFPGYRDAFFASAEATTTLPVIRAGAAVYPGPVQVAVVDSAPPVPGVAPVRVGGEAAPSKHGRTMARVIEELACAGGRAGLGCHVAFTHHLALDRLPPDGRRAPGGGYYGHVSTLAAQIEGAVREWTRRGKKGGLVVNVSLGVDPTYASTTEGLTPAAEALRTALDWATCQGALVLASAGNAAPGPAALSVGPMLPAGWTGVASSCGRGPIVYAVGAVDALDASAPTTREGARAELVAPGVFATVDLAAPGAAAIPAPIGTGSSYGPAVASAAAAILWAYLPELSASDVALTLAASGVALDLDPPADFCAAPPCTSPRRVSICRTLAAAIETRCRRTPGLGCVAAGALPCSASLVDAYAGTPPDPEGDPLLDASEVSAATLDDLVSASACETPVLADATTMGASPDLCPAQQYYGGSAAPGRVMQQPGPTPCRVCAYLPGEAGFYGAFDPTFQIDSAVLLVDGVAVHLGGVLGSPIPPGLEVMVTNLALAPAPQSASMAFTVRGANGVPTAVVSPIDIW